MTRFERSEDNHLRSVQEELGIDVSTLSGRVAWHWYEFLGCLTKVIGALAFIYALSYFLQWIHSLAP